jgi:hypothetical protein
MLTYSLRWASTVSRELETEPRSDHGHGEERPHGKPCESPRLRALPLTTVTAPALDPPQHAFPEVHTRLQAYATAGLAEIALPPTIASDQHGEHPLTGLAPSART